MNLLDFGMALSDAIRKVAVETHMAGGHPEICVLSPPEWQALAGYLAWKTTLIEGEAFTDMRGLTLHTEVGPIEVIWRSDAPVERLTIMSRKDWKKKESK